MASLALIVPVSLLLVLGFSLVRSSPSWWRHYTLNDELVAHATAVENAAVSQLTRTRATDPSWDQTDTTEPWRSAPWSIALRDEDASAWLTARLREWIEGDVGLEDWPEGLGQPQVRFEKGRLRLGAALRFEKDTRVVSAAITPEFHEDGSLWLRTDWVHIGRFPLPAGPMLAHADREVRGDLAQSDAEAIAADADAVGFFDILRGKAPLAQRPILRLDDGRAVRLLGFRLSEGRIELDCQTVARESVARN